MKKAALRKVYLGRRMNLTDSEVDSMSRFIAEDFFKYINLRKVDTIHAFLPIQKNKEVNTWPIINRAISLGKKIVISKTDIKNQLMVSFYHTQHMEMQENEWGIPEPVAGEYCADEDIDLVLMPLLVADKKGHRVGYGKGFYDRFLKQCRGDAIKVGLSLFPPVEVISDVNKYDVKLDYLITPRDFFAY
ncbi:MAG: 5-formyltetrahydrofolate cyclo-ligase [Cyclobacteriaceae bacterium]